MCWRANACAGNCRPAWRPRRVCACRYSWVTTHRQSTCRHAEPMSRTGRVVNLARFVGLLSCAQAVYAANALPPAPGPMQADAPMTYYLGLTVNGLDRDRVEPVLQRDGHFWLQDETLRSLGLQVPAEREGLVAVDQLPGVKADYDGALQMLHLTVPSEWLPTQHVGGQGLIPHEIARSSLGALFNYDVYYSDPAHDARSYVSAFTEQRVFDGFGVISNTGVYTRYFGRGGEADSSQRDRY